MYLLFDLNISLTLSQCRKNNKTNIFKPTQQEITDYCQNFQTKANSLTVSISAELTEKELIQLGAKREEEEIEKFVSANTQEISKDKWLCPLSGKKFKGPEFVRKHIFNKHVDKLDDVKKEVINTFR